MKAVSSIPEPLFLEERRRNILELLRQRGRVSVKALSQQLHVSAVTIRQDLRALEREGLLERTYGGAVQRTSPPASELAFDLRRERSPAEKRAIGQAAAALVQDGYSLALDASTTAYAITPHLKHFQGLTIVTNSLIIAQQFLDSPRTRVILPGGRLRRDSISIVGSPSTLPHINLNLGFFSAGGLSLEAGATDINPDEAEMKRALIARCVTPIIVVDSSKWGQIAPYTYLPGRDLKHVITTTKAPADRVAALREAGVRVDLAPVGED